MPEIEVFEQLDIIDFIRLNNIFQPNSKKCVKEIEEGDIVCLGRQPCVVSELSKVFETTGDLDFDKSKKSKLAILIKGSSILWPGIEYENTFLYHDDNELGFYSGIPDLYDGLLISIDGDNMKIGRNFSFEDDMLVIGEEVGKTKSIDISNDKIGDRIRHYHAQNHRLVVTVASWMGVRWVIDFQNFGLPEDADDHKPDVSTETESSEKPDASNEKK